MPTKRCYYEVLGITRTSDDGSVKAAYRKLVLQYHPDRNAHDPETEVKFKEVQEAYEVLREPGKRQRYDRYGHAGMSDGAMGPGDGGDAMSDMVSDFFGGIFGGGGGKRGGRDVRVEITLDLEEAYRGGRKSVNIPRKEKCGDCSGSGAKPGTKIVKCKQCGGQGVILQGQGFFRIQRTCPYCSGRGQTIPDPCRSCQGVGQKEVSVPLEINIPAGVENGMRSRVQGYGESAAGGGAAGDLHVFFHVLDHPFFQRDGRDLACEVPITFSQGALGAEVLVPTLAGKPVPLRVTPGQQSGDQIRIPSWGMPEIGSGRVGDLIVVIRVETPRNLTKRQEELFRELAGMEETEVSPQRKSFLDRIKEFFTGGEAEGATPASADAEKDKKKQRGAK